MRNNVALRISDKRGSKRPKTPENSPFMLGIAEHSDLRGGSMSPRLFLQQNTAKPKFYPLSSNCRILRSLAWLAYLVAFVLQSAHRAFFRLTRGYLRQKRRRLYQPSVCSRFYAELRLPPRNSPDQFLCFRRTFCFYHPYFIVQINFTDPPKLEGGVCHKPLCCRRCRRTCDEAEAVYHPDSFTCLIFDRRKSGCRGNADSLYSSFLLVISCSL